MTAWTSPTGPAPSSASGACRLRAEYEVFDVSPDKVDMISLGIMWTFF